MHFFQKIFSHRSQSQKKSKGIYIFVDADLKRKIQTHNKTVAQYQAENQFDSDQFLYLLLKQKKSQEIYSKRKLNPYEWLQDVLDDVSQQFKGYIIIGYNNQRNSIPRMSSSMPISDNPKCIRSGFLQMFSDSKNAFQECHLKLHHDYLTYYKIKAKQKKVSFMPLQNSIVQTMSQSKYAFIVKDKFKNIIFQTTSKEDMIGWLVSINQAIKVRNSQLYLHEFDEKLTKSIKQKVSVYYNKCLSLKQQSRIILLDQIGRKALKSYLKKNKAPEIDYKMLSIIQSYLFMCKCRRQKGQAQSQQIISAIKVSIQEVFEVLPQTFKQRSLQTNHQFIKIIQEIMKYLDNKYKKEIVQKKYLYNVFQHHLVQQYKETKKIPMKSLLGIVAINQEDSSEDQKFNENDVSELLNESFSSYSPVKRLNISNNLNESMRKKSENFFV